MRIHFVASSNLFTPKGWGAFVDLGSGHSAVMFACVKGKIPKLHYNLVTVVLVFIHLARCTLQSLT